MLQYANSFFELLDVLRLIGELRLNAIDLMRQINEIILVAYVRFWIPLGLRTSQINLRPTPFRLSSIASTKGDVCCRLAVVFLDQSPPDIPNALVTSNRL